MASQEHHITFPFGLATQKLDGGLPRIVLQEMDENRGEKLVKIHSTDPTSQSWRGAQIEAADAEPALQRPLFKLWFGTGHWTYLHPDAHTNAAMSDRTLQALYPPTSSAPVVATIEREMKNAASPSPGSLDFMLRYTQQHAPGDEYSQGFNSKFHRSFSALSAGSVVNWQDYFFAPSVERFAESFRKREIFQSWHLHTTIPDSLHMSEWGQALLRAISKVDVVYTYANKYNENIAVQLRALNLPLPEFRIFEYGLDNEYYDRALTEIHKRNFSSAIPGYAGLLSEQQRFIEEVFRSQGTVKHRFLNADRADQGKGVITLLDATEKFLDSQPHSLETLQRNFRFFFLHSLYPVEKPDPTDFRHCYAVHLAERHAEVQKKYPGVVHVSPALAGEQRVAIPALMVGCHGMTGGAQDGFNITIMENAYVNRLYPTGLICGKGAGFAIEAIRRGYGSLAFFPKAGDTDEFVDAIAQIVKVNERGSSELQDQKSELVDKYILTRQGRLLVDR